MLKKAVLLFLAVLLSLGLFSCGEIEVTDTYTNGLKWGNTLATEQGNWIALRAENKGKVSLALYNKKTDKTRFLLEGDVYHIAMAGNKIYFKYLQGSELYCYDLATNEYEELLSGVMAYQIHGGLVYYLTDEHGAYLHTYDLATAKQEQLTFKHTVNAFWITDHGIYYNDDEKDLFIVKRFSDGLESIIYRGLHQHCRDVVSLGGANIAFMMIASSTGEATLCTYFPEGEGITKHLSGEFTHYNLAKDRLVTVIGTTIVAVDYTAKQNYDWGDIEDYLYPQVMSDCLVLYTEDNAPHVLYYPE